MAAHYDGSIESTDDPELRFVEEGDGAEESDDESDTSYSGGDEASDNLVARYFAYIRQFALLSRSEEQALWRRIENARRRERRALYAAPVSLPRLRELILQVERGSILFANVLCDAERQDPRQGNLLERLTDAAAGLTDIAKRLRSLRFENNLGRTSRQRAIPLHGLNPNTHLFSFSAPLGAVFVCDTFGALRLESYTPDTPCSDH